MISQKKMLNLKLNPGKWGFEVDRKSRVWVHDINEFTHFRILVGKKDSSIPRGDYVVNDSIVPTSRRAKLIFDPKEITLKMAGNKLNIKPGGSFPHPPAGLKKMKCNIKEINKKLKRVAKIYQVLDDKSDFDFITIFDNTMLLGSQYCMFKKKGEFGRKSLLGSTHPAGVTFGKLKSIHKKMPYSIFNFEGGSVLYYLKPKHLKSLTKNNKLIEKLKRIYRFKPRANLLSSLDFNAKDEYAPHTIIANGSDLVCGGMAPNRVKMPQTSSMKTKLTTDLRFLSWYFDSLKRPADVFVGKKDTDPISITSKDEMLVVSQIPKIMLQD